MVSCNTGQAIIYDTEIKAQLKVIDSKYHSLIKEKIEEQLFYEPLVETKNRKSLDHPNMLDARWEIRFGHLNQFRVFYNVQEDSEVHILAIGVKIGNILTIGKEEIKL